MRLQKFLSQAGCCSRREGEKYITQGRIRINGEIVTTLGVKVNPETDRIEFDKKQITIQEKLIYIALNKPRGYVTSCKHPGDKIVLDLIDIPERIYPIGRLDKNSTGLLLLTNDGRLHHRLSHPSFDHEKEYEVTAANPISDAELRRMAEGLLIMGTMTRPAEISRLSSKQFHMILKEGKKRQIRHMVEEVGNRVTHLKRLRVSSIRLGKLPEGTWRYLTEKETAKLLKML